MAKWYDPKHLEERVAFIYKRGIIIKVEYIKGIRTYGDGNICRSQMATLYFTNGLKKKVSYIYWRRSFPVR